MKTERMLGLAQKWIMVIYWLVKLVDAVIKLTSGATNYVSQRAPAQIYYRQRPVNFCAKRSRAATGRRDY